MVRLMDKIVGKLSQLVEALIDSQTLKKRCAHVVHAEIQ